jgi:iron complex outermembrane receptor protein
MNRSWRARLAAALLLCSGAPPAAAQDPAPRPARVESLVVTARRLEETLVEAPLSVSAFGAAELERLDAARIDDLSGLLPNVELANVAAGGAAASRALVRGIGEAEFLSVVDPRVATYLDGVYLARAQGPLLDLVDVERVEVLRGPQGTLFGRNTIGGAVQVISAAPRPGRSAYLSARVGNLDAFESRAMLNLPLAGERLLARFNLVTRTRDGYSRNRASGSRWDDDKLLGGRAALRWRASDALTLDLAGDWSRQNEEVSGAKCRWVGDDPRFGSFVPLFLLAGKTDYRDSCLRAQQAGPRRFESGDTHDSELDSMGAHLTARWALGEALELRSISAWRRVEWQRTLDIDSTREVVFYTNDFPNDQDQLSQELNLSGSHLDGRLSWVGGLFYFRERADDDLESAFLPGARVPCPNPLAPCPPGLPSLPIIALTGIGVGTANFIDVTHSSLAAYGELTFELTPRTSLALGLRRTVERKELDSHAGCNRFQQAQGQELAALGAGDPCGSRPLHAVWDVHHSERFHDWSPRVILRHRLGDALMVYGSFSQGYRSGGFNGRDLNSSVNQGAYEPEQANAWELGLKASLLGERLQLASALFYTDYEDIQRTVLRVDAAGNPVTSLRNAAEATVRGFELEASAAPLPGLQLRGSWALIEAEYDEYRDQDNAGNPLDRREQRFSFVPRWKYSLAASYELPPLQVGTLTLSADYSHRGAQQIGTESLEPLRVRIGRQGNYGLLGARASLLLPDGRTRLTAFGTNLLDREYFFDARDVAGVGFGTIGRNWAPPRLYGLEIRYDWGARP